MKPLRFIRYVVITALLLAAMPVGAQERPRVGLALSGGAARGFAHVGVMKVLEEAGMPIDCISGNSMGAIIGGLYAAGYSVAELESLSVHVDWDEMFSDAVGRRTLAMAFKRWDARYTMTFPLDGWTPELPSGLIAGQKITKLLSRLTVPVGYIEDFSQLPTPFSCVATDIVTGEAVVLEGGNLAEAIRASMSVPTAFTPVVIDGRLLVDGGVARNLPAVDVRNLGADIVIGVNAAEPLYKEGELNSMIRIMDQTIHFQIAGTSKEQKRLCDVLIVPETQKTSVAFDQAAYFIECGEEAARAMLPRLRALADSVRSLGEVDSRWQTDRSDSLFITNVAIEGLERIPRRVVETELQIRAPLWMTVDDIDKAVDRIYKYDYFERVGYTVEKTAGKGSYLHFEVVERSRNVARAGVRYDSETNLAAIVNATLRNIGIEGSSLALDFRIGRDIGGEVWYLTPVGRTFRSFGVSGRVNSSWRQLNVYLDDYKAAEYRTTYTFGELALGNLYASRLALAGGARAEYIDTRLDSGAGIYPNEYAAMFPAFALMRIDTIDRTIFPRRGIYAQLMAEATSTDAGSDIAVTRYHFDWQIRIPVHRAVTLFQTLYLGATAIGEPPAAWLFTVGGMQNPNTWLGKPNTFVGLKYQELIGPNAQTFGLGVQWECFRRVYAIARWNIGNVFDEWNTTIAADDFENGVGLTLGIDIPAAPVEFTVSNSTRHDILFNFTIGYFF